MTGLFDYGIAFSRNLGWVTETEQATLRTRRIAIAGLGGVGGSHLLTLTRLGIGKFNIADLDVFELANFNRQAGASLRQVGRPKVDVLAELALDINPERVDATRVDLANHRGPSTPMACELCAGLAATQALKILLGRGKVPAAPWGVHFDAYRNKLAFTWRPGGNRHPWQRLGLWVARRRLGRKRR